MIFENVCRNPANCQIHGQKTMQETFRWKLLPSSLRCYMIGNKRAAGYLQPAGK